MASNSSILAWRISWTEEPGGAAVHGTERVGHDLEIKQRESTLFANFYEEAMWSSGKVPK